MCSPIRMTLENPAAFPGALCLSNKVFFFFFVISSLLEGRPVPGSITIVPYFLQLMRTTFECSMVHLIEFFCPLPVNGAFQH